VNIENDVSPPALPFRRSMRGRWIAGVCAGLARRQGWDPAMVRLGGAALTLATGIIPGVVTYVVAWMVVPAVPGETSRPPALHRSSADRRIGGVCGGLAESQGLDPALLRLLAVFITLVTAILPGVLTYLVAWIALPLGQRADDRPPPSGDAVMGA
jgi:phage shock protein PspC (stress-responsive transcriptional regulator)